MAGHDPGTIQSVRQCLQCGYNLYGLARQGTCPECGHAYKRRKGDAVAKNPRRQLAPLRRMLREKERIVRWYPVTWLAMAGVIAALYMFDAELRWWILISLAAAVNSLIHYGHVSEVRHYRQRIEAIDLSEGARQDRTT